MKTLSADETYQELLKEAKLLAIELQNKLYEHGERQKTDPSNWGYVGDIQYVIREVKDIL